MANVTEYIKKIIDELTKLQTVPAPYHATDDDFPLPRMIDSGNGGSIIVSQKIDDMIIKVADQLRAADASLSLKVTCAEWRASVRRAFGPALDMIDPGVDPAKSPSRISCGTCEPA